MTPKATHQRVGKEETGALPSGRLCHIQVNATEEQRKLFTQAAGEAGLTFSAWARARLLIAAKGELKRR